MFQQTDIYGMRYGQTKRGKEGKLLMHALKAMKTCEMQRQSVAEHGQWWCDDRAFSRHCSKCKTMQRLQDVASNQSDDNTAGWGQGRPTADEWPIHCVTESWIEAMTPNPGKTCLLVGIMNIWTGAICCNCESTTTFRRGLAQTSWLHETTETWKSNTVGQKTDTTCQKRRHSS